MYQNKNTGSVKMAAILNILLVVFIGVAIYILLARPELLASSPDSSPPSPPSSPAAVATTPTPAPEPEPAPAPTQMQPSTTVDQAQIDALKQQLESENSRLAALREEEELIEKFRSEAQDAGEAGESSAPNLGQSQPGLITPMGFPDRPPGQ